MIQRKPGGVAERHEITVFFRVYRRFSALQDLPQILGILHRFSEKVVEVW
jgi:hypothetical protein